MSAAVTNLDAALGFLAGLVGAEPLYEVDRPAIGGRAVGLWIADHVIELVEPSGKTGAVAAYIERYGPRLRATQFRVLDLGRAEQHLSSRGLRLIPGDFDRTVAIDPADNYGVNWQFTEQRLTADPRP
jgi:hypothetical protein